MWALTGRPSRASSDGALHQRHADAADHAAGALARGQARIDDAARTVGADQRGARSIVPTSGSIATSTKTAPKACIEYSRPRLSVARSACGCLDGLAAGLASCVAIGLAGIAVGRAAQAGLRAIPARRATRRRPASRCPARRAGQPAAAPRGRRRGSPNRPRPSSSNRHAAASAENPSAPSWKRTCSIGRPSVSAATCVIDV